MGFKNSLISVIISVNVLFNLYINASGINNLYVRNTLYDGFTCKTGDFVAKFENIRNGIACIARCAQHSCIDVFYYPSSKLCEGCFTFHDGTALPESSPKDSLYYQPVTECPGSFARYNRSCYTVTTSKMTWNSASSYCQSINGYLATLENADEDSFVSDWLVSSGVGSIDDRVYFGATDSGTEGNWMTINGNSQTYLNWANGQPNSGGFGFVDEDCTAINMDNKQWNDMPCGEEHIAVCEIDLI